jgi:hypothetical protein
VGELDSSCTGPTLQRERAADDALVLEQLLHSHVALAALAAQAFALPVERRFFTPRCSAAGCI